MPDPIPLPTPESGFGPMRARLADVELNAIQARLRQIPAAPLEWSRVPGLGLPRTLAYHLPGRSEPTTVLRADAPVAEAWRDHFQHASADLRTLVTELVRLRNEREGSARALVDRLARDIPGMIAAAIETAVEECAAQAAEAVAAAAATGGPVQFDVDYDGITARSTTCPTCHGKGEDRDEDGWGTCGACGGSGSALNPVASPRVYFADYGVHAPPGAEPRVPLLVQGTPDVTELDIPARTIREAVLAFRATTGYWPHSVLREDPSDLTWNTAADFVGVDHRTGFPILQGDGINVRASDSFTCEQVEDPASAFGTLERLTLTKRDPYFDTQLVPEPATAHPGDGW